MPPRNLQVLRSYRHIYRQSLHAIQFASPARHTLRKLINNAYRTGAAADFNARKIKNTLLFLECATRAKGLEHSIIKSLLHVWWFGRQTKMLKPNRKSAGEEDVRVQESAFDHFEVTVKMLNESMDMCLPTGPDRRVETTIIG